MRQNRTHRVFTRARHKEALKTACGISGMQDFSSTEMINWIGDRMYEISVDPKLVTCKRCLATEEPK